MDVDDALTSGRRPSSWDRRLRWAALLYIAGLLTVLLAINFGGDRWWFATIMMFGPKWVYTLPTPMLVLWAVLARVRSQTWLLLAASGCLLAVPIAGLCLPWRTIGLSESPGICVLTCNTGRDRCQPQQLAALIADVGPDIVCLQEFTADLEAVFDDDWNVIPAGDLVIASRDELMTVDVLKRELPGRWPRPICHLVRINHAGHSFKLATLHLFSPRYGLAEVTSSKTVLAPWRRETLAQQTKYRRTESQRASQWLENHEEPLLIVGDFNMPISSTIYRECWNAFHNAFTEAGFGFGHTVQIDEGGYKFTARIDHILASRDWRTESCWVGPDVGSDHRPVIARVQFRGN